MTERTPSTPQSLAQLRDAVLARHHECHISASAHLDAYPNAHCEDCDQKWGDNGCDAHALATLLSVENVAAAVIRVCDENGWSIYHGTTWTSRPDFAAALLGAIPVDTQEGT